MAAVLHKKAFSELTVDELYELLRVRSEVFVVEQDCVYLDMDGDDQASIHLWLTEGDQVVALCRVCPAGTHMREMAFTSRSVSGSPPTPYCSTASRTSG